jgi:hypothetical protein
MLPCRERRRQIATDLSPSAVACASHPFKPRAVRAVGVAVVVAPLRARSVPRLASTARRPPRRVAVLRQTVDLPALARGANTEQPPARRARRSPDQPPIRCHPPSLRRRDASWPFSSTSATVPLSGTVTSHRSRAQVGTWALSPFVTPMAQNLSRPGQEPVRARFLRIVVAAHNRTVRASASARKGTSPYEIWPHPRIRDSSSRCVRICSHWGRHGPR